MLIYKYSKPLSFHGVAFGSQNGVLRRMAQIAREIQDSIPRDPLLPQAANIQSSFAEALDSVCPVTFLITTTC